MAYLYERMSKKAIMSISPTLNIHNPRNGIVDVRRKLLSN